MNERPKLLDGDRPGPIILATAPGQRPDRPAHGVLGQRGEKALPQQFHLAGIQDPLAGMRDGGHAAAGQLIAVGEYGAAQGEFGGNLVQSLDGRGCLLALLLQLVEGANLVLNHSRQILRAAFSGTTQARVEQRLPPLLDQRLHACQRRFVVELMVIELVVKIVSGKLETLLQAAGFALGAPAAQHAQQRAEYRA